ncbi:TonB-dependent siderophore receptor [uncultured Sphingomonas sp.]|uniref:TonB-dependent receptor plug domain-containing protein n=1 Tax=uncultured Sphingomonas sp. TaxID=158754 RepID=UPI00260CAFFF|nr:TonB-dependent receptor [uncultured Sphingomonas sp.]
MITSSNAHPARKNMSHRFHAVAMAAACTSFWYAPDVHAEEAEDEEAEEIVVQATRTGRRVQDEPIRVEVIGREEIEEKLMMTPGNISMLVAETGGVRVQVTSPSLGASSIRMQGMKGRYTSLLADGLPLYGGQASSIGLLQIAPTDLGQVEIIKGAASALYGPSALGGVINLVSRRPGDEPEAELLANITSRDGQDLTAYAATPIGGDWGASIVGGVHRQSRRDIDEDGWADLSGYDRWTVRPRLFWSGAGGAKLYATLGTMHENRRGGTLPGRVAPDGQPFPETQNTRRLDGGIVAEAPVAGLGTLHLRASAVTQKHKHRYGEVLENDRHGTIFSEASLAGGSAGTTWLAGFAYQSDTYRSETFPGFDYSYDVPGVLAQIEHQALDELTLATSARLDFHSEYGTRLSPRISALYKPGALTIRASLGRGFYAPTPFVEEIEAAGLSRLAPLAGLRAETADTASFDVGYVFGPFETNIALFASRLHDAVRLEETGGGTGVRLINADGITRTQGAELLLRYRRGPVTVTGSYVHVDATEPRPTGAGHRIVPLTPRHTAGLVAMWEKHGRGRIGIEAYYTGPQSLDDNPYRTRSRPYVELGMLGEISFGKVSLFLNAENLLNVRQTRYDPILRRERAADGRWTVDAWAPLDGFTLNGGMRVRFGGH